jgi:hypothetical protein
MEGFTFDSALDLNMGYYHIKIDYDTQKLCTIVFPCHMVNLQIKILSHGYQGCLVPDVSQTLCQSLSKKWNMLRLTCYIDDLLILTNSSFKDHLLKLEMVITRLSTNELLQGVAGMRVNIFKSKFFAEQIEYLAP